jgi:energy-coupling factor transport system permease protein
MAIRIVTMISCGIIFLSTTRVEEIAHGLTLLGLPHTLGFALSLALRLVPVFVAGAKTTLEAQAARGARLDGKNLLQKLRRHTPFLLPILIQALKKTDLLAASLESKGFGRRKRGYYLTFQTRWIDYTLVGGLVLLFFACLYLRIKGIGVCITKT